MHEVSLVRNVFRSLEDEFSSDEMERLSVIKMKIGKLSNVEPILMQNAFEAVKVEHPQYAEVKLEIELVPVQIHCDSCGENTVISDYRFVCSCGTPSNNVISGTELLIHQVEFLEPIN